MDFDHIGLITKTPQQNEDFVEATKVWVTNPNEHPFKVEWLRYEPDSPVKGPVRTQPHVSFRVDNIQQACKELTVLIEPFDVGFAMVGFYQTPDGAVIELMEYKKGAKWQPE